MAHQKSYTQILAHSMLVLPLQIAALYGVSPVKPTVHTTHSPTVQWICRVMCQNSQAYTAVCRTVVQIQGLHHSTSRPSWLVPNFPHSLRCYTTARYILPCHLGSEILTQQCYGFKSTLRTKPCMPNPMLISTLSNWYHSMLVSQLPHLTPWGKSGYPLE